MPRKALILRHGGGELANQLWNYASIYAYGIYADIPVKNPSFFEYHSFFKFLPKESFWTKILSSFYTVPRRRTHPLNRIGRFIYLIFSKRKEAMYERCVFTSQNSKNVPTYLPPTEVLLPCFNPCKELHFTGWLFRNPKGLEEYRNEIIEAFRPREWIEDKVVNFMCEKSNFAHIVGVHLRKGDYKTFKGGTYLITDSRAREIIEEYIRCAGLIKDKTFFVICSDGKVDERAFSGLNFHISKFTAVEDLFLLSKTQAIIGSDSSFGAFSAYFGNIPHIIMKNEPIDWQYYKGKKTFFFNKYSTMVHH